MDKPAASSTDLAKILEGPTELLKSAGFVFQNDLNGVKQVADHLRGTKSENFDSLKPGDPSSNWSAAGSLIGHVAEYALLNKVLGGLMRPGEQAVMSATRGATVSGISGATIGFLQPVTDDKANFGYAKFSQAAVGFGTFATMSGTEKFLAKGSLFGRPGRRTLADSISINAFAGATSGVVGSELTSLLNNGHLASAHEVGSQVVSNAAFGAVFGAVDAKLSRIKLSDETSPEFKKSFPDHDLPSTEKFVREHYDADKPLTSPILSWLALHRPELRPANYEALSQNLHKNDFLDLAAWSPEGRVKVVQALRSLSESDLTKDAQIDEFIGALKNRKTEGLDQYLDAQESSKRAKIDWHNAFNELVAAKDVHAPNSSLEYLVATGDPQSQHPELQAAIEKTLQAEKIENETASGSYRLTDQYFADATASVTNFLKQAKLPGLQYRMLTDRSGDMSYGLDRLSIAPGELVRPLAGRQIGLEFHEVRHHEDGTLRGELLPRLFGRIFGAYKGQLGEADATENAADGARWMMQQVADGRGRELLAELADPKHSSSYIWSARFDDKAAMKMSDAADSGKSVTFSKNIPAEIKELARLAQSSQGSETGVGSGLEPELKERLNQILLKRVAEIENQARDLYLNGYVGEKAELRAWSAALLANLRTRAWGIPDTAPATVLPPRVGDQHAVPLRQLRYPDEHRAPAFGEEFIAQIRAMTGEPSDNQPW